MWVRTSTVTNATQHQCLLAEEDRDHLYHAHPRSQQDFPRQQLRMKARAINREPEEDRDHLYHQR